MSKRRRQSGITPLTVFLGILIVLGAAGFLVLKVTAETKVLNPVVTTVEEPTPAEPDAGEEASGEMAEPTIRYEADGFTVKVREATPSAPTTEEKEEADNKKEDKKQDTAKEDTKKDDSKEKDKKEESKEETKKDDSDSKSDSYLCKSMSSKKLTESKLKSLKKSIKKSSLPGDRSVVQMLINELYARNGYHFESKDLQKYFKNKSWYKDKKRDKSEAVSHMNKTEKENLEFLTENR